MTELLEFLRAQGFADFEPILDGTIHRFDNHGSQTGWFIGYETENPKFIYAKFGDWKTSESHVFKSSTDALSPEEKQLLKEKLSEAEKNEEKRKTEENLTAQKFAKEEWAHGTTQDSPYLLKKGFKPGVVKSINLRTVSTSWGAINLLVPLKDINGEIWSIQTIQEDGQKFFQPGGRIRGCFYPLGEITPKTQKIYVAEGIATALSIYLATNSPTVCGFNAGNLEPVARALRGKYPNLPIIIAGDDDRFTIIKGEYKNPGRLAADRAASAVNGIAIFPRFKTDETSPTDWNDLHIAEGLDEVKHQLDGASPNPKEIIKTQSTGFHVVIENEKGVKKYIPEYDDLYKYFNKIHNYKILDNSGVCLVWNGKFYEEYVEAKIQNFAEEHFFPKPRNSMVSEFLGKISRKNLKNSEWFTESSKTKLNFGNGVLDKETGEFELHNPKYGFRYVLNYNYDPTAKSPIFDKFLKDVAQNDEEKERMLLEFMGYAISNDKCFLQKALVLEGEGSNGKSTLCQILQELAGEANFTTLSLTQLEKIERVSAIDGKLFNISEETPRLALAETSTFKHLASGGVISARKLRENSYQFYNKTKLILSCNDLPRTSDATYGLIRRFIIIPFRARFTDELGNKDGKIDEKLKAELPGIFNRVWEAYKICRKNGKLSPCKDAARALDDYKELIDPMGRWLENTYKFHPLGNGKDDCYIPIKQMFPEYVLEMERQQEKKFLTEGQFYRKLATKIKDYDKRKKLVRNQSNKGVAENMLLAVTKKEGEEINAI